VSLPILTLVSKPDCHLCHEMKALVLKVLRGAASLEEKDVRSEPELEKRFLFEIPVLLFGNEEVARHQASEAALEQAFRRLKILV
jgi:hypothetical protein